jgi:intracellular multiplication protein IcmE
MQTPDRLGICKQHGLKSESEAYSIIASCAKSGSVQQLLQRNLDSRVLHSLGYDLHGMRRLGYSDDMLAKLGFLKKPSETPQPLDISPPVAPLTSSQEKTEPEIVRELFHAGASPAQFKLHGYTVHHLKKAGFAINDLERAGFQLDELAQSYSAAELRRAGYGIRELKRLYNGHELRNAGFDATDMRNAGYGIRDLLKFGYNENQVKVAGFSINELSREGLTRQTIDKRKF